MTVMKKELNVKGLTTLWSRDKDGSYVDDGIKNTIIQELLTKKRNAHVLDLAEKAKMPVNITAERVSMEEARSFMNDGVNPLEAHIISYHEKMLIEKKNTDRKKRETMKNCVHVGGTYTPYEVKDRGGPPLVREGSLRPWLLYNAAANCPRGLPSRGGWQALDTPSDSRSWCSATCPWHHQKSS